jgi:hypothetical protein
MTQQIPLANADLVPLAESIDGLLTAARADAATANSLATAAQNALEAAQIESGTLQVELDKANLQIAALTPPKTVLGTAGTQASFAKIGAKVYRQYNPPTSKLAPFKPGVTGATDYVVSVRWGATNPWPVQTVVGYAQSLPQGCRFSLEVEPEQISQGISTALLVAQHNAYAGPIRVVRPDLKLGTVEMTYTQNSRFPGDNPWLDALVAANVRLDWVGFDGYFHGPSYETPAAVFKGPFDKIRTQYPGIEIIVTEWGADGTGAARAAAITAAMPWFQAYGGVPIACYFDENNGGNEQVDNDPLALAALQALA